MTTAMPALEVKVEKPIAVVACAASNSHDTGSAWADPTRSEKCCKLSWRPSRISKAAEDDVLDRFIASDHC
jgi:hypothetical protein